MTFQLGRLDSASLLSCLAQPDTTYPLAWLLLAELADRSRYWTAAEANEACHAVVKERLYLGRWRSAMLESGLGRQRSAAAGEPHWESVMLSVSVFDWAVRPRVKRRRKARLVEKLIRALWAEPGPEGKRVVVALLLDERSLRLTQAGWRALLAEVLPPSLLPTTDDRAASGPM